MAAPVSTIKSNADIRFRDHAGPDQNRNEVVMFLDFRVFIMGVEVTSYVKDSITYTRAMGSTENTCTFTLDNAYDRFVMTAQNFQNYSTHDKDQHGNDLGRPTFKPSEYSFQQSQDPEKLQKTGLSFNSLTEFDSSQMYWVGVDGRTDVNELAKKQLFEYKIAHILEFNQANAHNQVAGTSLTGSGSTASSTTTAAATAAPVTTATSTTPVDVSSIAKFTAYNAALLAAKDAENKAAAAASAKAAAAAASSSNKMSKYKLTVGSCVINLHDEVRVFVADPNHDPVGSGYYRWMPVFAGVVSSAPVQRSYLDGGSTISVTCSDIRYLLRKMRITGNIQSTNQTQTYIRFDDAVGIFQDAAIMTSAGDGNVKFENLAALLSYRQLTRALLCGDNPSDIAAKDAANAAKAPSSDNAIMSGIAGTASNNTVRGVNLAAGFNPWYDKVYGATAPTHLADKVVQLKGVGNFSIGFEISNIRPMNGSWEQRVQAMESWQDLQVFGAKMDWYTDEEVTAIGLGTKPVNFSPSRGVTTSSLSPFSILNSFVHYLFPGDAALAADAGTELGIRNLIERALVNPQADTSWTNRLDLLMQCTDTIDYKVTVNGMGDICFEFPMYDFTPNFFGKYAECFALGDSLKSDDVNDEGDGNVVAALKVTGSYKDIEKADPKAGDQPVVADRQYSIFIKSDTMASKYGIIAEEYAIPWSLGVWPLSSTDAAGKVINTDAIHKNTLISFGIIEFFRRITAMSSMSMEVAYNPFLFPNRPLLNKPARRIGLIDSVTTTLNIDGAPTVQAEARWIRHASQSDIEAADGHTYRTITGYKNTPFGYFVEGLALFTTEQLDGIRTEFGIEIIDPATNKIDDASKAALQNGGRSFNDTVNITQQPNTGDMSGYAISNVVVASYKRWETLSQTDPETAAAVNRIAAAAGADPRDMYRLMEHESGGRTRIDPQGRYVYKDKPNKLGAQGIIQFMPDTLRSLLGRNGKPVDPATFLQEYPTVMDQSDLAVQYYTRLRRQFGPLDTPYKLIMATVNPASINDDMFADFAQSNNAWTRRHADAIKANNHVTTPAGFCAVKGYSYYNNGDSGTYQVGTKRDGTPRMEEFYTTKVSAPAATPPASAVTAVPGALPGLADIKRATVSSTPTSSLAVVPKPKTEDL